MSSFAVWGEVPTGRAALSANTYTTDNGFPPLRTTSAGHSGWTVITWLAGPGHMVGTGLGHMVGTGLGHMVGTGLGHMVGTGPIIWIK